ncbi:helix-turn-helix transcriptional regulator [Verrucomicrobiota bacterium]
MTQQGDRAAEIGQDRLITINDAAEMLGMSARAVYRLVASQELPGPVKIGRSSRMSAMEVQSYITRLKSCRPGQVPNQEG